MGVFIKQLEKRFYSRSEIAEITNTNISDNKHFKRNIENTLNNWGYQYKYSKAGVVIAGIPETPKEKLNEILLRELKINSQKWIDPFIYLIYLFAVYDDFRCMPWPQRQIEIEDFFNDKVSLSTLKSWFKLLEENNIITSFGNNKDCEYWITYYVDGKKCRERVNTYDKLELKAMKMYFDRKKELLNSGLSYGNAMKKLWSEEKCYYYKVNTLLLNACGNCATEIVKLVIEIVERGLDDG